MKARKGIIAALVIMAASAVLTGLSRAQEHHDSAGEVEIFIQGKKYTSLRDYKRHQINISLREALSTGNFKDFSFDELCEILKEVRESKLTEAEPENAVMQEKPRAERMESLAPGVNQMQDMLEEYLQEHEEAEPILMDPQKVKSVIIQTDDSSNRQDTE